MKKNFAMIRKLDGVVVAHHVVSKHHIALPGQIDGARRNRRRRLVLQPAIRPMPMRRKYAGMLARPAQRPVQIAAQVIARQRLDQYLFDRVTLPVQPAENGGFQVTSFRIGQQSGCRPHLLLQVRALRFPVRQRRIRARCEMHIRMGKIAVAGILGKQRK